jgi:hypothetical protein
MYRGVRFLDLGHKIMKFKIFIRRCPHSNGEARVLKLDRVKYNLNYTIRAGYF